MPDQNQTNKEGTVVIRPSFSVRVIWPSVMALTLIMSTPFIGLWAWAVLSGVNNNVNMVWTFAAILSGIFMFSAFLVSAHCAVESWGKRWVVEEDGLRYYEKTIIHVGQKSNGIFGKRFISWREIKKVDRRRHITFLKTIGWPSEVEVRTPVVDTLYLKYQSERLAYVSMESAQPIEERWRRATRPEDTPDPGFQSIRKAMPPTT